MQAEVDRSLAGTQAPASAAGTEVAGGGSGHRIVSGVLRVTESVLVFAVVANLCVLGMYVIGNFQAFADDTLLLLLSILSVSSLIALIVSGYYVVLLIATLVVSKNLRLVRLLLGLFAAAISGSLSAGVELLQAVLSPIA